MDTVTYTEFRQKLAGYLNKIEADRTPLIVTRQNAPSVVVMSLSDFKAYEATFHFKYNWSGFWSRRITKEHRLVYAVEKDSILIAQCIFNY